MLLLPGAFKIWKLIVCTQVSHQHGYVAEPMSQEEHDQIAQYLTICECCGPKILDEIFLREKVHIPQQLEGTSRTPGGSEALTFIMRFTIFFSSSMILIQDF